MRVSDWGSDVCSSCLRDQLARPVAGPEFQRAVGFEGRPIGYIGFVEAFLLKMAERFGRFPHQLIAPAQELLSEILLLERVHERLRIRRLVVMRKSHPHLPTPYLPGSRLFRPGV